MNTIFKTKFGSHLYGTNSPTSDLDFKSVYIDSFENIILNKSKPTLHIGPEKETNGIKNNPNDIDEEVIELRTFIKDCLNGQTYALDMLFSPENMWIESSEIWWDILFCKDKLLSKQVAPYIGYCRQQAGKYGLKGSRLGELQKLLKILRGIDTNLRLKDVQTVIESAFINSEFVKIIVKQHKVTHANEVYLEVLGKYYSENLLIKNVLVSIEIFDNKYGERARLATLNEGVDWKAISHAYRCMYQLEELALTGQIIFPLKDRVCLKQIKYNEVPYNIIQEELPTLINKSIEAVNSSIFLSEEPDIEFWNQFLVKLYKENM